jgi:hypothetical protein
VFGLFQLCWSICLLLAVAVVAQMTAVVAVLAAFFTVHLPPLPTALLLLALVALTGFLALLVRVTAETPFTLQEPQLVVVVLAAQQILLRKITAQMAALVAVLKAPTP